MARAAQFSGLCNWGRIAAKQVNGGNPWFSLGKTHEGAILPSIMNARSIVKHALIFVAVLGARSVICLEAQTADVVVPKKEEPVKLEKFVVTGSYIPFAADATAIPVKVVTAYDIQSSGESGDLLEVIRKMLPQFVGNSNLGSSNSNISGGSTNGGSQIKLRNVQTLVLINGRRAAFAPVTATGGFTFVDVNAIPVSAVEKIEVLSDGASALYGSDAVSGVVNIILKHDFDGTEIGGGYRFATQKGHWAERSAHFATGARSGKKSITISGEWVKSDPLFGNERDFSRDQTLQTGMFPGAVYLASGSYLLSPSVNAPPLNTDSSAATLVGNGTYLGPLDDLSALFNLSPSVTLQLRNERKAATMVFDSILSDKVTLFCDLLVSNTKTFYQLAGAGISGMPLASANVVDGGGVGITAPEHPQNPFDDFAYVTNRFIDYPRGYYSNSNSLRVVTGIRGKISDAVSYETGINLNWVKEKFTNTNVINRSALAAAIDAGKVNLFAYRQTPGILESARVFGTATSLNRSTLKSWDGRIFGELPKLLPTGPIGFALGGEVRKETLAGSPDAGSNAITDIADPLLGKPTLWDGATSADSFVSSRTIQSLFTEIRLPVVSRAQGIKGIHELELDVAARYDRYSDTEDPLVPKVSLKYLPVNDEFALRASYSKAFTAPDLFTLFGPTGVGYTDNIVNLKPLNSPTIVQGDQAFLRLPSNPKLQPEKATSYSGGFVYSPQAIKGLTVEANYFRIHQTGLIGQIDEIDILQDVETFGPASKYAAWVRIGGFGGTPIAAAGDISKAVDAANGSFRSIYLTNYSQNFVSAKQDGVDLSIDYTTQVGSVGKLNLSFEGMWFNSFTVDGTEYVGTTNGNAALNGGTIPRWRGSFRTSLDRNDWQVGLGVTHIPNVLDTDADPAASVASFTSFDLFGSYRFPRNIILKGLIIRAGVNNVFDRMPPLAPAAWTDANADTGTYGALGRVVYIDVSYQF